MPAHRPSQAVNGNASTSHTRAISAHWSFRPDAMVFKDTGANHKRVTRVLQSSASFLLPVSRFPRNCLSIVIFVGQ
jgi:hypothetical protein